MNFTELHIGQHFKWSTNSFDFEAIKMSTDRFQYLRGDILWIVNEDSLNKPFDQVFPIAFVYDERLFRWLKNDSI